MPKRYYKLVGHRDRHTNSVAGLTLANGTVVNVNEPVDISTSDRETLEEKGYIFESSSKKELEEIAEATAEEQPVGNDVVGAVPDLGADDGPNQAVDQE